VVTELEEAVAKEDSHKMADVSGFRLDAQGNSISKKVRLVKSEMYLTELMESICEYIYLSQFGALISSIIICWLKYKFHITFSLNYCSFGIEQKVKN